MPARTVAEYLATLPEDRRGALERVRSTVNGALPRGYEEGIQYGMIGWWVPHSLYPAGYHAKPSEPLPFLGLASRSGHMALHVMALYGDPKLRAWFEGEWKKSGKKLDLGGGCIRFKSIDGMALDVLAAFVKKLPVDAYVKTYEAMVGGKRKSAPVKRAAVKKAAVKRAAVKKAAVKRAAVKRAAVKKKR